MGDMVPGSPKGAKLELFLKKLEKSRLAVKELSKAEFSGIHGFGLTGFRGYGSAMAG